MAARWLQRLLLLALCLGIVGGFAGQPVAAADHRYFPETGHYLGGEFRHYWERNGGLYVFGCPIPE